MQKFWNFTADENGGRVLRIDGYIIEDDPWFLEDESEKGEFVAAKKFKDELNSGTGDITLWINSGGGDVFAANEIYNALSVYPGKITVKIDALAASAASVVVMAGDVIEISRVGLIMIHDPMTIAFGNIADMERTIEHLTAIKDSIINAYEAKTGLDRDVIAEYMSKESYFDATEAVKIGFADKIIGEETPAAPVVNAALFSRKNMYKQLKSLMAGMLADKPTDEKRISTAELRQRLAQYEQ